MSNTSAFSYSIGRKILMGLTGIFLITFLLVHCFVNSLIFFNDGGETFNIGAHFMTSNWIIRAMEVVLFAGILAHIFLALQLTIQNRRARPVKYAVNGGNSNSKWYSRWMGLLGTLILMFLIVHIKHFWVVTRITGLEIQDINGNDNLFFLMKETFTEPWVIALYFIAMISLAYHLLHGFQSAFQSLGLNHKKYTPLIKKLGLCFSLVIPALFASMPLAIHFGWIK